jgi:hypothetical protein
MEESEIPVVRSEQFGTFRQVIRPKSQDQIAALLQLLHKVLRLNKFTGHITMHLNQGGVREIVTEQKTAHIPEGSVAGKVLDATFKK